MCLVNELGALTQLQAENETARFTLYPSQLDPFSGKTQTRTSLAVIEIFMKLNRADDFGPHQTMQLLKSTAGYLEIPGSIPEVVLWPWPGSYHAEQPKPAEAGPMGSPG